MLYEAMLRSEICFCTGNEIRGWSCEDKHN